MQLSQAMKQTCEKAQRVAETTAEAISKELVECWDKVKVLGEDLKEELSSVHKSTKSRASKKRRKGKRDKQ